MKKEAVVRLLVILMIIVVVVGGFLLIFNNKGVKEEEVLVSEGEVLRPGEALEEGLPEGDLVLTDEERRAIEEEQAGLVEELQNVKTADECENVGLKEQCYLSKAVEENDASLCEKITFERYKTICLEKTG